MEKHMINDCYFVKKMSSHIYTKNILLNSIENFVTNNPLIKDDKEYISNTDWNIDREIQREWFKIFMENNRDEIFELYSTIFKNFHIDNIHITNWWFQQYENNSSHGWHNHGGCNFSNVYYLELPKDSSSTEFFNFYGDNMFANATEGDLVVFPAHIPHRAINNSQKRRTVLVFNSNIHI